MTLRTTASVERLTEIKDVTDEIAAEIRKVWRTQPIRSVAREAIDVLLGTCGVEYLGVYKRSGEHAYYCNAGDAYSTTVLFIGARLIVGCWGDLVEQNLIKETA